MAIVISGINNNDKITASDGKIDILSGVDYNSEVTAPSLKVGSNIQFGNAGIITATTLVGDVTGNINHTSNLLLQISGSEKLRIANSGAFGLNGTNYGTSGQVLTSQGSGSSPTWSAVDLSAVTGATGDFSIADKIVHTGDTNTALRFPAADTITAETGGSERLRITSDGDVNVLTGHLQAQDLKLGLLGDRFPIIQRAVASSGSQSLSITGGSGYSDHTGSAHTPTDAKQGALISLGAGNPTSDTFGGGIKYYANGHTNPNNPGVGNQHAFYTRSGVDTYTERFRISEDGQLLQGETNPYDTYTAVQFRKDVDNQARFIFRNNSTAGSSRVRLDIMTQNRAGNTNVFSGIEKYQSGGMNIINGENTNEYSDIGFWSNGYRSLRLRNGNYSTDVAHFYSYWGTSNGIHMEQGGPQSGTHKAIRFTTSHYGGERGYIGVTLGGTSYNSSSDYRQKQDVVDLTGAIDRVKSFKPRRFKWKDDPTYTVDGFLAHEAQTVVPESVVGEKDDVDENDNPKYQVIDQSKLVPLLTASIKELIAKVENLETKVSTLEGS